MTAQYQVDVTGGWGYLRIVDAIYLPAQVGDADDDITLLFLFQNLCHFLCLGDRIEILDAAIVDFGYQAGKFRTQAENANLQSFAPDNGIRLYNICQFGTTISNTLTVAFFLSTITAATITSTIVV